MTTLPRLRWLRGWRGPMRLRRGGRDAMNLGLRSRRMLNSRRSCFDFLPWRRRLAGLGLGGDGMPSLGLRRRSMMDLGRRRFACFTFSGTAGLGVVTGSRWDLDTVFAGGWEVARWAGFTSCVGSGVPGVVFSGCVGGATGFRSSAGVRAL